MNKLLKGAVAGAAGIALLLGGAGTFAAWNDQVKIGASSTSISTGHMHVTTDGTAYWYDVTNGFVPGQQPITPDSFKAVPGDKIEYRQPITVDTDGANLAAAIDFDDPALTGAEDAADFSVATSLEGKTANADGYYAVTGGSYTVVVDVTFNDSTTGSKDDDDTALALGQTTVNLVQTAPVDGTKKN
jgi:alternate signal-mediated exported protein